MIFCWRDEILPIPLVGFTSRLRTNGNDELPTGIVCPLDPTWREKDYKHSLSSLSVSARGPRVNETAIVLYLLKLTESGA